MSEELKRRSRLAAALIAGPAVTVGMLGAGAASALADTEEDPENDSSVSETEESEEDGELSDEDSAEGSEDAAEGEDPEDSGAGNDDSEDPANEGGSDTGSEDVETDDDDEIAPQDQHGEPTLEVDENQVEPGDVVTLTGSGFDAGEDVELVFASTSFETVTADDEGEFITEFTVPEDTAPDEYPLVATGAESGNEALGAITVVAPDEDDDEDDEDESDLEEASPEPPARYGNAIEIPDVEGVIYAIDGEPVDPGTVDLDENETVVVEAAPDEGYEFGDDVDETTWSFNWEPTFEDHWPNDPPEDWEPDEDRWYSNVPEENRLENYADWILEYAENANRNADESLQEFESDTQVYAEPDADSSSLGDLFPDDGAVWWGYLEDEDFWMIVQQYTGAVGFVPGDSHIGEDPSGDLDIDESEVEPGDEVTVTGSGFDPGEDVEFSIENTTFHTEAADDDGGVTAELTIPENLDPGEHTLTATGADSGFEDSLTITVSVPDDGDDNWWDDLPQRDDLQTHPNQTPDGSNPHVTTERTPLVNAEGDRVGYVEEGAYLAIIASDADWPAAQIATEDGEEIWVEDYEQYLEIISFDLILDQDEYQPGDEVTAIGEHLAPEEDVDFDLEGESVGIFPSDEDGEATAVFTLPEDIEPGEHLLTATGAESGRSGSVLLTVAAADEGDDGSTPPDDGGNDDVPAGDTGADGGEELAETGMTTRDIGLVAGLLLLVGGALSALGFKNRLGRRDA